ncbi:universal stress protein [Fulvimarina sp. 2208YS6-2-32]|uniref:Universal stress protein n=1 Tax=Fulvimarina uroteuthidis TaxID=3098149 RepID=A0ABU5HXI7_9HYPH|nr:universal stress protein [Fulvimarina sp. 2208YS6-2-32]MDY8107854.1 universal stress protein [Fulvimarina sp. 2208YS6-2-32]
MVSKRISPSEGGKRKFLAIIDDTPECLRAAEYAAWRAKTTGGAAVFLYVVHSSEFQGQWFGVEEIMRAEATEEASTRLGRIADNLREKVGVEPETLVREGDIVAEIGKVIEEDQEIAILVLASGEGKDGPGPLVSAAVGKGAAFPIPVTIIPFSLDEDEIASLC